MFKSFAEYEDATRNLQSFAMYYLDIKQIAPLHMPESVYYVQEKKDGVYGNVVCIREHDNSYNTVRCYSRDNKQLVNTQWTEKAFRDVPEGIYQAEFCIYNGVFEDASRFYNPNVKNQLDLEDSQRCKLYLFDYVSIDAFIRGHDTTEFRNRFNFISSLEFNQDGDFDLVTILNCEIFYNFRDAQRHSEILKQHERVEGTCIKKANAHWKRGARTSDYIKDVKYHFYDLRITGYLEGKGKHARVVAKLVVDWYLFADKKQKRVQIPVDGMLTYEQRKQWWNAHQRGFQSNVGKIGKIRSKGLTKHGMPRQAKFIEVRWDKSTSDFD